MRAAPRSRIRRPRNTEGMEEAHAFLEGIGETSPKDRRKVQRRERGRASYARDDDARARVRAWRGRNGERCGKLEISRREEGEGGETLVNRADIGADGRTHVRYARRLGSRDSSRPSSAVDRGNGAAIVSPRARVALDLIARFHAYTALDYWRNIARAVARTPNGNPLARRNRCSAINIRCYEVRMLTYIGDKDSLSGP